MSMNKTKIKGDEELIKVLVEAGDAVFVKYERQHKPIIEIFRQAIQYE